MRKILITLQKLLLPLFFVWLFVSPLSEKASQTNLVGVETALSARGGGRENSEPFSSMSSPNKISSKVPTQTKNMAQPKTMPNVKGSEPALVSGERIRYRYPPGGNPGGNGGGNPGGNGDNDPDITIGTKKWEEWVCPDPDEIISSIDYWNRLQNDPDPETCLEYGDDMCSDDDDMWEIDDSVDIDSEKTEMRRRLFAVNPNPPPVGKSTPTGKLDQQNLEKYDFTSQKIQPFNFRSREGILLSADHRALRKIIYAHAPELGLSDLINRIPCPIQSDPDKFQRITCWAITDRNMKDALIKVFESTTFMDPNIITVEMPMHECPAQKATYFIDQTTGSSLCFRKGGKQDGKLWTAKGFDPDKIPSILQQPEVKVITDLKKKQL
jgi:hypothetical protein